MTPIEAFSHPHLPDLTPIAQAPLVIRVHLLLALGAFAVATFQILGPKGTGLHRVLGWIWVVFMAVVAISSFFIHVINPDGFSLIHLLSVVTLIALPVMVYAARRRNVKLHKSVGTRLYLFALVGAGLFTLFPGRLIWRVFFG
jgi:uncharacterized membrane protein